MDSMDSSEASKVSKHFWCSSCSRHWMTDIYCEPEQTGLGLPDTGQEDPFNFYAICPECGQYARANHHYYANLGKMHDSSTGPRTAEGKRRSSLNGIKHGLYAKSHHLLAPANGKYDICKDCEEQDLCDAGKIKYCPFKTDLLARFLAAYENGDEKSLRQFAGLSQGRLYLVFEQMMQDLMERGVLIQQPKVSGGGVVKIVDDQGAEHNVYEYVQNPLLDTVPKIMTSLGMTSDQQAMNPAKQGEDDDKIKGKMDAPPETIHTFMNDLRGLITDITNAGLGKKAAEARANDPVASADNIEDAETPVVEIQDNPFNK